MSAVDRYLSDGSNPIAVSETRSLDESREHHSFPVLSPIYPQYRHFERLSSAGHTPISPSRSSIGPIPTILISFALVGSRGKGYLGAGKAKMLSLLPVILGVGFA